MHLYFTNDNGTPHIYTRAVASSARTELTIPAGVTLATTKTRPDCVLMPGADRMLILGMFNKPLVWIPSTQRLWVAGITAPTAAPTLAAGSAASITGIAIGKFTFAERRNGVTVHESSPGPASNVLSLSGTGRSWSGLPTSHANARVTHKGLYVSMDGGAFLFVAWVPLANSTHSESVPTNALDQFSEASENRDPPPAGAKYGSCYNRRLFLSTGSDSFVFSELDEPESFGVTSELKTRDARNITCLRGLTNELVIGTRKSIQQIQGFGVLDFNVTMVTQDIGIISHHGSKVINDKLWFPSQDGYYRYSSGGFQFLMPTLRTYFRDEYEADPEAYEDLVADVDRRKHVFLAMVPGDQGAARTPFFYVGFYLPSETSLGGNGELPHWTFDTSAKYIRTISSMTDGDLLDRLYSGACDGYVRLEGVDATDDDGTAINWYLIHKHMYMGAQDGDEQHAKTFEYVDLYLKSENAEVTVSAYCGDDAAADAAAPQWTRAIDASAMTYGNRTGVPKTGHRRQLVDCSGHGISVKVGGSGTSGEYRGFALEWRNEGEQSRGST